MTAVGKAFMLEVRQKAAEAERAVLIAAMREAYTHVMDSWPVYSGFSKANNRISITGREIRLIRPGSRKAIPGLYSQKAESVRSNELAKLSRIERNFGMRNRTLVIGNAVDYASDVGFQPGRGRVIYQQAASIAKATASAVGSVK